MGMEDLLFLAACPQLLQERYLLLALQWVRLAQCCVGKYSYQALGHSLSHFHDSGVPSPGCMPQEAVTGRVKTKIHESGVACMGFWTLANLWKSFMDEFSYCLNIKGWQLCAKPLGCMVMLCMQACGL